LPCIGTELFQLDETKELEYLRTEQSFTPSAHDLTDAAVWTLNAVGLMNPQDRQDSPHQPGGMALCQR